MIDELLYYPHFCFAAVMATVILFIMYFMKRNYPTRSNRVFLLMLADNLAASLLNIATFYTISFPERYPLWVCYLVNLGYLFLYNLMAVLFLLYVNSLTQVQGMNRPVGILAAHILVYDGVMLAVSPYTHLLVYFDEEKVYRHGSLMFTLYLGAFLAVFTGNLLFISVRKKFNFYQIFSIVGFSSAVFISVLFQLAYPRFVISNFVCAMVLFFIYAALENPAYFMHGDTTCYNRRAFMNTIFHFRRRNKPYVIIAVQMMDFEILVHSLGRGGIYVLSERIAERLSRVFGKDAYFIEIDRFAVVGDWVQKADEKINMVKKVFAEPFRLERGSDFKKITVQPSISVLRMKETQVNGHEMAELLRGLDRNSTEKVREIHDIDELLAPIQREKEILRAIDEAIRKDDFQMYYQPIYDVKEDSFHSAEALIRMKNDKGEFVSPEEFIPIAEKNGRIGKIGSFVFQDVCKFMKEAKLDDVGVNYIEINLSPEQCRESGLVEHIMTTMQEYGIEPSRLNLEITETARMENNVMMRMSDIMSKLHRKEITFSLDDFGSGFAAINYLTNLPVDIVKIDKGILWQAMRDDTSKIVLKSTIRMIKEIGRKIVVEGVETEEMANFLIENGCDYLQGYYYSRPIPGDEYRAFLQKKNIK